VVGYGETAEIGQKIAESGNSGWTGVNPISTLGFMDPIRRQRGLMCQLISVMLRGNWMGVEV
jgi:hypothetical protein